MKGKKKQFYVFSQSETDVDVYIDCIYRTRKAERED